MLTFIAERFIKNDYTGFVKYLLDTLYTCFGIAVGIMITISAVLIIRKIKRR